MSQTDDDYSKDDYADDFTYNFSADYDNTTCDCERTYGSENQLNIG